jgi:hypothetical protein
MNVLKILVPRAAAAICAVLSACAAAPGSYGADSTGAAYGAFLAARYASAQSDPLTATRYYETALQADPKNQALRNEGFIAAVLAGSPRATVLATQVSGNACSATRPPSAAISPAPRRISPPCRRTIFPPSSNPSSPPGRKPAPATARPPSPG